MSDLRVLGHGYNDYVGLYFFIEDRSGQIQWAQAAMLKLKYPILLLAYLRNEADRFHLSDERRNEAIDIFWRDLEWYFEAPQRQLLRFTTYRSGYRSSLLAEWADGERSWVELAVAQSKFPRQFGRFLRTRVHTSL